MSRRAVTLVVVISILVCVQTGPQCGLYGSPPCQFVPAPPGQTPSCAGPGKTYCEHVDHYPTYVIKHLVHKWGYESKNIIVDETGEDFEALKVRRHRHPPDFYDASALFLPPGANQVEQFGGYKYESPKISPSGYADGIQPEPIYIPKPRETEYLLYSALSAAQYSPTKASTGGYNYEPKVSQYNQAQWLKRYGRDLGRVARTRYNSTDLFSEAEDPTDGVSEKLRHRAKRQSPGRSTLCQSNSHYITPQAALNSKGNWMYVVNEVNTARQLVKTETCASSVCSNLCQLPNGYNSRCEQKHVQKRLVALNANGQNLYTDTFWFPSCCVCTLSN